MASLLRVSRCFARAARQVAAPVVTRVGSGGAVPSGVPRSRRLSFLRGGSAVDAPPLGRAMSSHTDAPSPPEQDIVDFAVDDKDLESDEVVDFVADDKDLESDEALWALYERWCKHFDEERDQDEMVRYFPTFKETALRVDRVNKANLRYKFGFNKFSDGKLRELCFYRLGDYLDDLPYSVSWIFANAKGTIFKKEEEDDCPGTRDGSNDGPPKGSNLV